MKVHDYLTLIEVLEIHKMLIEENGGTQGLRDAGALEAELIRPQSGYYNDQIAEASALFESLAMNIYSDMMKMFDTGTFNIAHIEPWLRSCVSNSY